MDQNIKKDELVTTNFALRKKPLISSYNGYNKLLNYLNKGRNNNAVVLQDLSTFTNSEQLDTYFAKPGTQNDKVINISETLYATNRIYANFLDYFRDMYYWRYVTVPRKVKGFDKKLTKEEYQEMYQKMLEIIDGLSIETTFPTILLNIFKNGQVYVYCHAQKNSKTITTILLPNKFCRATNITQYGTQEIDFDMTFFDSFQLNETDKKLLFSLFPEEFETLYDEYKKDKSKGQWQHLNGKVSTCFSMNEQGFPTFLSVFYDLIDYKTYKINELERSANKLERLVAQEIDLQDSGLELDEVEALHNSMAEIICDNRGTKLVTSVGKLNILQLQEGEGVENKTLLQSYESIYDNAGINRGLFAGESSDSISASITRDLNFVWNYIERIVTFYNLAINNLYNFKNYQVSLRVLPISPYNEKDKLEYYSANAQYGVGKLDLMMASGIKQVDLESTIELEQFLDLANRLAPLQSSHTQSSSAESGDKETPKEGEDVDAPTEKKDATPEEEKDPAKNEEKEQPVKK